LEPLGTLDMGESIPGLIEGSTDGSQFRGFHWQGELPCMVQFGGPRSIGLGPAGGG